jgi:hypothetical protein
MAYRTFLVPFSGVPINHSLTAFRVVEDLRNLETGCKPVRITSLNAGERLSMFAIVIG